MNEDLIEKFIRAERNFPEKIRQMMLLNHIVLEVTFCKNCTRIIQKAYNYFAAKHDLPMLSDDFLD